MFRGGEQGANGGLLYGSESMTLTHSRKRIALCDLSLQRNNKPDSLVQPLYLEGTLIPT